ncbi:GbsR/MarR family transcriptional regulator [Virgibacillus doumboii]|uniref:GbsR/MarR family transcriptional regulator n=1 Tax=Virgibacillus doumboii TaxID=2697503 RepID=UPI0013DF18A9|nr:helix-turn-helix domain-containing protein [Virgibacillus doumboii]
MFTGKQNETTDKIMLEFAKTIEMFGLTPLEARLFVYLYIKDKPMTLDEMSEALGKSKTSMSTSSRNLSDLNLVTRVWKKGVRKDLYEGNSQLYKSFMNTYTNKWIDAVDHQKDSLEEVRKELEQHNHEQDPKIHQQLLKIIEFHKEVEASFRNIKKD